MFVAAQFNLKSIFQALLIALGICTGFGEEFVAVAPVTPNRPPSIHRPDHDRCYAFPNGWGGTPEAATRDLDRVCDIYKDRPGFFRHDYVKIVPISRNQYEADGCVSFLARDAKASSHRKDSAGSK